MSRVIYAVFGWWLGKGCRPRDHREVNCQAIICFCQCHRFNDDGSLRT